MMTVSNEQIIKEIFNRTGTDSIASNQTIQLIHIIDDEDSSNIDKSASIMEVLGLRGLNNRKAILETLELYTF